MTRVQVLLASLAAVLVVVLFWLMAWSPKQQELEVVREDIAAAQQTQQRLTTERNELRAVRDTAPELEAQLAAASAVVPADPALPSALRQLQQAADESGAVLASISPARPVQVEGAPEGISAIALSAEVSGGYFQVIDFLRRIEDPAISPRGLVWSDVNVARGEYPTLNVALNGTMYARLPGPPASPEGGEPVDDADGAETAEEVDE